MKLPYTKEDNVLTGNHIQPSEYLKTNNGLHFLNCWPQGCQRPPVDDTVDYLLLYDVKVLLLKTSLTCVTEHGEIKLVSCQNRSFPTPDYYNAGKYYTCN